MTEATTEKDELEKIMSEIEELQHEMEVTSTAPVATVVTAAAAEPKAEPTVFPTLERNDFEKTVQETLGASATATPKAAATTTTSSTSTDVTTEASDEDILKEIQASAHVDDSDMESTLAQLKEDETETRGGILDEALEATTAAAPEMDSELADVLDQAIASAGLGADSDTDTEVNDDTDLRAALTAVSASSSEGGLTEAGGMSMASQTSSGNSGTSSGGGAGSGSDGSLTLTLTGNMTLKLKYEFEGQEVMVSFADQALRVQMSDGTEFKVPVARLAAATTTTANNVKPFKKTG
jgi:hypothetical protein